MERARAHVVDAVLADALVSHPLPQVIALGGDVREVVVATCTPLRPRVGIGLAQLPIDRIEPDAMQVLAVLVQARDDAIGMLEPPRMHGGDVDIAVARLDAAIGESPTGGNHLRPSHAPLEHEVPGRVDRAPQPELRIRDAEDILHVPHARIEREARLDDDVRAHRRRRPVEMPSPVSPASARDS